MNILPIAATAAGNAATQSTATSAFGLGFDALLKIILTQLTYQDPLKPMDNYQFVSQLAQFSQIQQGQANNDELKNLVASQGNAQAVGILGKRVDVNGDYGPVTGVVTAIALESGAPTITVQTVSNQTLNGLPLSDVTQIRDVK